MEICNASDAKREFGELQFLKEQWASFITRFALFAITDLIKQENAIPFPV